MIAIRRGGTDSNDETGAYEGHHDTNGVQNF